MIELELFYKIVESEIRHKHIKYLKNQKCLPSDQLPLEQTELQSPDKKLKFSTEQSDEFVYSDKPKLLEKVKRVKAFDKGIETALKVLTSEYKRFINRLNTDL